MFYLDVFGRMSYPIKNCIYPLKKHFIFQNKGSAEALPYKGGNHPFLDEQNEQDFGWLS
jgi:hypothetical protein